MAMQVQCPNASCGKDLIVQEQYAGKKGKCPSCGAEVTIPAAIAEERSPGKRQSLARSRESDPEPGAVLPIDYQREREDRPLRAGNPTASVAASSGSASFATHAALAVGISALLFLSFSPRMNWVYVSKTPKPRQGNAAFPQIPSIDFALFNENALITAYLSEPFASVDFLCCSLAVAMLALIALMLASTPQNDLADGAIAASGSAAVAWGVLVGIWQLGIVWKVFNLSNYLQDQQTRSGLAGGPIHTSIWPGPGLGVGLLAALVVVVVFGSLVASRKRFLWLLTAGGVGFVMGILLLALHVKPWKDFGA